MPRRGTQRGVARRRCRFDAGAAGLYLEEHFVLADHAKLGTSALLDRFGASLQVAHVGIERIVAHLELRIRLALRRELAIRFANLQPPSLAQPHWILQPDDQQAESKCKPAHRAAESAQVEERR